MQHDGDAQILHYLSDFFSAQSADEDDEYDLADGRNVILANQNNVAEQGQEGKVCKLQANKKT